MTGAELKNLIDNPPPVPPFLVEQFLPTNCTFMLTGKTGKGKSVIATQLALSLSSGTPIFGTLVVSHPRTVYYLQLEGNLSGQLRRLSAMQEAVKVDADYLEWDADRCLTLAQRYDRIASSFAKPPDLVIADPIYKLVSGDLAKAEEARKVIDFSDRLQALGCAVFLVHHPHRDRYSPQGKLLEEEDSYYGHSFLKNHVEISYAFHPLDLEGESGQLVRKKAREENTLPVIDLLYHPETYTCSMFPTPAVRQKREAALDFLKRHGNSPTSFQEVKRAVGISVTHLRELQAELVKDGKLKIVSSPGKRSVWIPSLDGVYAR